MTKLAMEVNFLSSECYDDTDNKVIELLSTFYMQLIHQPVEFTALGFFSIRLEFLASVVTGTLTYVVFLIQFYIG